jgi:hypothetical protein
LSKLSIIFKEWRVIVLCTFRKAEIPDKEKWAKYPVRILHYMYEYYDGLKSCMHLTWWYRIRG